MELSDVISANILGNSIVIAVTLGLFLYVFMRFLAKKVKYKFLYITMVIFVGSFTIDAIWSHLTLESAKQKLAELNSILEEGTELRLYNETDKKISENIEFEQLFISAQDVLAEIRNRINNSSLKVTSSSGFVAMASRFNFDVKSNGEITSFVIIAHNIIEIRSEEKLYRYLSEDSGLYEEIECILQRGQLPSENKSEMK